MKELSPNESITWEEFEGKLNREMWDCEFDHMWSVLLETYRSKIPRTKVVAIILSSCTSIIYLSFTIYSYFIVRNNNGFLLTILNSVEILIGILIVLAIAIGMYVAPFIKAKESLLVTKRKAVFQRGIKQALPRWQYAELIIFTIVTILSGSLLAVDWTVSLIGLFLVSLIVSYYRIWCKVPSEAKGLLGLVFNGSMLKTIVKPILMLLIMFGIGYCLTLYVDNPFCIDSNLVLLVHAAIVLICAFL